MRKTHWPARAAAGCLVTLSLVGVAFAAGGQGSQSDPLVTLSYLTQQTTPAILSQVDSMVDEREAELEAQQSADDITTLSGQVTQITKTAGGEELTFLYDAETGWSYTDPVFPTAQDNLEELANLIAPLSPERVMTAEESLDAYGLAEQAGEARAVNLVLLGVLCARMDSDKAAWLRAIESCVPAKFVEVNKKAFELGYQTQQKQ